MIFQHVPVYAGDPILSLMEEYKQDTHANKVNLGIGLYYDDNGVVPQLKSVQTAYGALSEKLVNNASLYLPIEGLKDYREVTQQLLFGALHPAITEEKRITTVQTIGGSGALKIGADFLKQYFPQAQVWVSQPTWENHIAIFQGAGFIVHHYPYWNEETGQINFEEMCSCLLNIPKHSIVLLHPCCHNPTGMDLSDKQFDLLIEILQKQCLIPFLDLAYQGLGRGLVEDTYLIQQLLIEKVNFLVANSYSKIFSLYGERVGALSVVCESRTTAECVLGQLKSVIRRNYSSSPTVGALLISHILGSNDLKMQWMQELEDMRTRINTMRHQLKRLLNNALSGYDFEYLTQQQGMFSYTHLNSYQITYLRKEYNIYLLESGRMCMAGLNSKNVEYVADAIVKSMKK